VDRAAQPATHRVEIKPGQQNLEIYYAGLAFSRPEQVKFKYQLLGFDRDWVDAGTRRTAYYPQLPPRSYTFKVAADNGYGVWNMEGPSLSVIVLPPFYQTWWFVTLASLTVAGLMALIWRQRVAQLQRAHAAQQAFSRQLIASQESERKRIAAELHDSLGQRLVIIKNLALILLNGSATDGAREQIDEISSEASQALGEVREISYNLRPHQLDRLGLTKAVEALVKKAAAASPIAFTAEIADIDGVFPKESEINFYRVAQESVSNVVKHSAATEASVIVRREDGRIALTVRDNGKGFAPDTPQPEPVSGGFGLVGISERATLLGGHAAIHSAPGRGTTIDISIDLRHVPDVN
jgi:signal transduction histidine kinase